MFDRYEADLLCHLGEFADRVALAGLVVGVASMALLAVAIGVVGYSWWWLHSKR